MDFLDALNQNTYMSAFSMLLMNLGSRYIALDISKAQEQILKNQVMRRITLFCIFYVATRNILTSIGLTVLFIVINVFLLHEESMFCVLPHSARKVAGPVSKDEYELAKKTVDAYEEQHGGDKSVTADATPAAAAKLI